MTPQDVENLKKLSNNSNIQNLLINSAEEGNSEAQSILGNCYDCGVGVGKDIKKAVCWYTKAAEKGNPEAQCLLGICYEYGDGVEQDIEKAIFWFRKAAEHGIPEAQYNMSICSDMILDRK